MTLVLVPGSLVEHNGTMYVTVLFLLRVYDSSSVHHRLSGRNRIPNSPPYLLRAPSRTLRLL